MGAPGTLIPAEVPSIYVPTPELDMRSSTGISSAILGGSQTLVGEADLGIFPQISGSKPRALPVNGNYPKGDEISCGENQTERFEDEVGMLLPPPCKSHESQSSLSGKAKPAQKMKVKNVSEYVISAAKNPEFAQKLHAILPESGASPPPDLFSNRDLNEPRMPENFLAGNMGDSQSTRSQSNHNVAHVRESASCAMDLAENLTKLATSSADSGYALCSDATIDGSVLVNSAFRELNQADALISGITSSNPLSVASNILQR